MANPNILLVLVPHHTPARSIARAVYFDAEIVFLDDPLAAVDAHVGASIFHKCFTGLLRTRKTTCVLVTNAFSYLPDSRITDITVLGVGGKIVEEGKYAELISRKGEFWRLNGGDSAVHAAYVEHPPSAPIEPAFLPVSPAAPSLLPHATKKHTSSSAAVVAFVVEGPNPAKKKLVETESRATGAVPLSVYFEYLFGPKNKGAGYMTWFAARSCSILTLTLVVESLIGLQEYWLGKWNQNPSNSTNANIYILMFLAVFSLTYLRSYVFSSFAVDGACAAHDRAISRIIKAPVSWFDTTPVGRILNRFAQDQAEVDESLPNTVQLCLQVSEDGCFGVGLLMLFF